jgi:hypothetical protein
LKKLILGAFLIAAPLSAASAMPVSEFLTKADALQKKGMMALFSSDYKTLKSQVEAASGALRKERTAAKAAGRPQAYCPPAKSGLNSNEILASFRSIPPAQRGRTDVKDALRSLLARKYPCRG